MDGGMDIWINSLRDQWMDGLAEAWMDGCGWMVRGKMDGWVHGWWMGGWNEVYPLVYYAFYRLLGNILKDEREQMVFGQRNDMKD